MRRRRSRKAQSLIIVILCFLVCGLTLGFASFSSSLTISSSANVKPDEAAFDINVYGIGDASLGGYWDDVSIYTSTSVSEPAWDSTTIEDAPIAKITDTGSDITISNLNVAFDAPGDSVGYYFMIRNDGEYDAYLDVSPLENITFGVPGICEGKPGTSVELVNSACEYITLSLFMYNSEFSEIYFLDPVYKLEKGDYLLFQLYIQYYDSLGNDARADGDFTVKFDDITFEFTSVPPEG